MVYILGIMGSPRRGGNTETLLEAFLEGVKREGVRVERVFAAEEGIQPCLGCRHCEREGWCKISDPMGRIYSLLRRADVVVLATPVFFYGPPAQVKALIDRSQALWARRYVKKLQDPKSPWRKGVLLAVGATKGRNLFSGLELTAKYFFDAVGASFGGTLGFRKVEKPGDIALHPTALDDARELARELIEPLTRRKRILFLCRHNARRSQMAEAFLQRAAGGKFDVESAGEDPLREVDPLALEVMAEKGVDLAFRRPKALEELDLRRPFDLVVRMGCEVECAHVPTLREENWELEDPAGKSLSVYRRVRDQVEARVKELVDRWGR